MVVGDWAWGIGASWPHPVIGVNRQSITVGIHRDAGSWLTTHTLRWDDIRGVIPAEVDRDLDTTALVETATNRVRRGHLSDQQREALAVLLLIAATATLPTPVTTALYNAITALTRTPSGDPTGS